MNESKWYSISGDCQLYRNDIDVVECSLQVWAESIEEACQKVRKCIEPIGQFNPTKCYCISD